MTFDSEDNGNCRVYYRDGKHLFCWQDETSWGRVSWKFYACSRDGEPSHEVSPLKTKPCPGETSVGRDLNMHLASQVQP